MAFDKNNRYFNKFTVLGTITDIRDLQRTQGDLAGTSYGAEVVVNTGSPSGFAHVRFLNGKLLTAAYDEIVNKFEVGARVAIGFQRGEWLSYNEREYNGKTYRQFQQRKLPELATVDQHERIAGKITGTLVGKNIVDDYLSVSVEYYDTDKDGNELLVKGESRPYYFTFVARDKVAELLYDTPDGANVELNVRLYNEAVRDDFGDIVDSYNEARIERAKVLSNTQTQQPPRVELPPQYAQPQQQTPTQQTVVQTPFHTMSITQPATPVVPFPQAQQSQQPSFNPFAGAGH